ncbi:MAG TPA: hypothetical protein VMV69_20955 [Pirellulales bacterium]|nr:hypothetical protein [Pirellulales bacterium]
MSNFRLDRWLDFLTGSHLIWTALWLGLVCVTVTLLALMATRWGQSKPLGKCVALSLLTHVLFATYATTIEIVAAAPRELLERVSIADDSPDPMERPSADAGPAKARAPKHLWEKFVTRTPDRPEAVELDPSRQTERTAAERTSPAEEPLPDGEPALEPLPDAESRRPEATPLAPVEPIGAASEAASAEPIEAIAASRQEANESSLVGDTGPERAAPDAATSERGSAASQPGSPGLIESLTSDAMRLPRMTDSPATPLPEASSERPAAPKRTASPVAPETESTAAGERERGREADLSPVVGRATGRSASSGAGDPTGDVTGLTSPNLAARRSSSGVGRVPQMFELRRAPNKARIAARQGGSADTEKAVKAALEWLATNQHPDGRWDASRFGAGQEMNVLGHDRKGAGAEADTGVTGLALLAFLAAGHTHKEGDYRLVVESGLNYLLASQDRDDGHIGGAAEHFAFMYCHGMATLALSEAYAMTRDERLLEPLRRAIDYTVRSQVAKSGSWRYKPGDTSSDTSQLGWQLMALKSAEQAGIEIPRRTRDGMVKFLKAVSSGKHGGLARYRIDAGERPTRSMTAEALVCRQFLGMDRGNPASNEAGDFLLGELPGAGKANFYYWYYATIGMFQLQGVYRERWNAALTATLLSSQCGEGDDAGSWHPNDLWGGHGGRVYTTAMGALCLEVYYRYLPLYGNATVSDDR